MRHEAGRAGWFVAAGLAGAVLLAPAMASAQDVTLKGTRTTNGKEAPTVQYISSVGIRTSTGEGQETIMRLDQQKVYLVRTRQKTYSEMTFEDMQKMADAGAAATANLPPEAAAQMKKMMGGMAPGGETKVTPLGPGETIAGYATEKYHVTMSSAEMDMWLAPAIALPPVYYDTMRAMTANPMLDMKGLFEQLKKVKGVPLKSVTNMKMMGQSISTTEVVTSVDKGAIPPAAFDVPAGFKLVPMK